jgi:hypothetical protein
MTFITLFSDPGVCRVAGGLPLRGGTRQDKRAPPVRSEFAANDLAQESAGIKTDSYLRLSGYRATSNRAFPQFRHPKPPFKPFFEPLILKWFS